MKGKDVLVFHKEKGQKLFLVAAMLSVKGGAMSDLAARIEKGRFSVLSGFINAPRGGEYRRCSFYMVSNYGRPTRADVQRMLEESPLIKDVEVKEAHNGILVDSLNFPLRWTAGDRAIMFRTHFFAVMEQGIRKLLASGADVLLYQLGYDHGSPSWKDLLAGHPVKDAEDLQEMASIYSAVGWGKVVVVSFDGVAKKATLKVVDNFEALEKPEKEGSGCNFIRGHLAGLFSVVFDDEGVQVAEEECVSRGDPACIFKVKA